MKDQFGCVLTAANSAAVGSYDQALLNLLTLSHDPVADCARATAADPQFVMGHCLNAALHFLGTDKQLLPAADASLRAARAASRHASDREKWHIAALEAFARGGFAEAIAHWEALLTDHPDDVLAMTCAHQGDFFLGSSSELRDRVARRLGSVSRDWPGYGFYQGMYAFGLEEMNQYAAAEEAGRAAVDACPRDAWAIHAVAHVMEMTGRVDDGILWLQLRKEDWSTDNFFQVHNWWHLGLYLLEQQRYSDVLALYDARIAPGQGMLDQVDASALLWRLALHDVGVGNRWQTLSDRWAPRIGDAWYGFNDTHAMMAFVGAERFDLADRLLTVMEGTASVRGENSAMTRTVSLPVARSILAYGKREYAEVVRQLAPIRSVLWHGGGSHAQRDAIAQTLIRAGERGHEHAMVRALLNERSAQKPASPFNRLWQRRAQLAAA